MPKGTSKISEPFWKWKVCENSDSGKMQYIGYNFQNISAPDLMLINNRGIELPFSFSDHIIEVTSDFPAFANIRGWNYWRIKNEMMVNSWTSLKEPNEFDFVVTNKMSSRYIPIRPKLKSVIPRCFWPRIPPQKTLTFSVSFLLRLQLQRC